MQGRSFSGAQLVLLSESFSGVGDRSSSGDAFPPPHQYAKIEGRWSPGEVAWQPQELRCVAAVASGEKSGSTRGSSVLLPALLAAQGDDGTADRSSRAAGGRKACLVPQCFDATASGSSACVLHLRASEFEGDDGSRLRFCQLCDDVHQLAAFTGAQRSCTARLTLYRAQQQQPLDLEARLKQFTEQTDDLFAIPMEQQQQPPPFDAGLRAPAAPLEAASLWLKVPHATPLQIPWGSRGICGDIRRALGGLLGGELLRMEGAIRPGCTLLTVDLLASAAGEPSASAVLEKLMEGDSEFAVFLRRQPSLTLGVERGGASEYATSAFGSVSRRTAHSQSGSQPFLWLSPMAVLCGADASLQICGGGGGTTASVSARLHGQSLDATLVDGNVRLRAPAVDGVALLHCNAAADSVGPQVRRTAALLLCANAAVVSEVNAAAAALLDAEARPGFASALIVVGHALRFGTAPGACTPELAAEGAAVAIARGWRVTAAHIIRLIENGKVAGAAHIMLPSLGGMLSHAAALSRDAWGVEAALAAGLGSPGCYGVRKLGRLTPLHLAASRGVLAVLSALIRTPEGVECYFSGTSSPRGLLAARARDSPEAAAALAELDRLLLPRARAGWAAVRVACEVMESELGIVCKDEQNVMGPSLLDNSPQLAQLRRIAGSDAIALAAAFMHARAREAAATREEQQPPPGVLAVAARWVRAGLLRLPVPPPRSGWAIVPQAACTKALRSAATLSMGTVAMVLLPTLISRQRRPVTQTMPEAAIRAAMPHASWAVWKQVPTAMLAQGMPRVFISRAAVTVLLLLLAWTPGRRAERLRSWTVSWAHLLLITLQLVILPMVTSAATHARFGGPPGSPGLRQPWQAGLRQLLVTACAHGTAEAALPPRAYAALMFARGALPLLVRAAEAAPGRVAAAVAATRVLCMQPAWDVAHFLFCLACVAHLWRGQRRLVAKLVEAKNR